ncbi:Protein FANTASTIC FOUR like [Actinidia chinensis var. chinensis]|uniref:Protein FANTASTIC FOUR like n=1 Tax=Actinidia chinensis var. chinensis TaxID=1590841 RepID=A0A2R6QU28_ACTCC|nr:Protein FANTASTIC FOUR like [Actinidia chinensis var. chinensis]
MSPMFCQGLQSCLEPSVLRQKDVEFRSFIQALTNISHNQNELMTEKEKVYVHPLSRRSSSSSTLSMKSLEMCTESLGSETGSEISERSDELSLISYKTENSLFKQESKSLEFSRKLISTNSFPPPLSSISGSDSFRVRPHREGGRLVIKAVTVSSSDGYFQMERVDGRLRLCLVKCNSLICEEAEEKDDDDDDEEEDEDGVEDMEGNSENVGGEIGSGEVVGPSSCKEGGRGNKERSSWGPLWVTIS